MLSDRGRSSRLLAGNFRGCGSAPAGTAGAITWGQGDRRDEDARFP